MTWFKIDDGFWRHRKVRRLGRQKVTVPAQVACAGLWVLAGNWSADNLSDGFVPAEQVETWDPQHRLAAKLIEAGLWHKAEVDGEQGYRIHQWDDYQPTRASIEADREVWRTKKAQQRRGKPPKDQVSPGDNQGDADGDAPETPQGTPEGTPPESPDRSPQENLGESPPRFPDPVPSRPVPSPPNGGEPPAAPDEPARPTAQLIIAEWLERCAKRPAKTVIGQISTQVKALLAEGQDPDDIRRGLAAWMAKGLHPSTLPSVINEVVNRTSPQVNTTRPSTADQAVMQAQALKTQFRDHSSNQLRLAAGGAP